MDATPDASIPDEYSCLRILSIRFMPNFWGISDYDRHGWKDSHREPLSTDAAPAKTQTVPLRASRSAWAKLIAKVYEVEPLIWPRCKSEMKLIAVITSPADVGKILRHLIRTGRAPPGLDPSSLL